jgi:hypothetical protein
MPEFSKEGGYFLKIFKVKNVNPLLTLLFEIIIYCYIENNFY